MRPTLRASLVIHLALVAGTVAFATIAILIDTAPSEDPSLATTLLYTLVGLSAAHVPAYVLVRTRLRRLLSERLRTDEDTVRSEELPRELFAASITGAALAEGAGVFGVVVFMLTREPLALVAPALAVILILLATPSRSAVADALDELRER